MRLLHRTRPVGRYQNKCRKSVKAMKMVRPPAQKLMTDASAGYDAQHARCDHYAPGMPGRWTFFPRDSLRSLSAMEFRSTAVENGQ